MSGPGFEPDLRESLQPAYATASEPSSFLPVKQSLAGMNGEPLRRTVTVLDPLGLHMRPLTVFAQQAAKCQSEVTVVKDGQRVNGKSPLELMLLAAEQGTQLILEVSGSDAQEAIGPLAELLAAASDEDSSPPPLAPKG
jgi:phosphocarrier protein HPr